jgi:hypothetical protein
MLKVSLYIRVGIYACLVMLNQITLAAAPNEFMVNYDARYRGLRALATISLAQQEDGAYLARSLIAIKLMGATVTSIDESSLFDWVNERPWPRRYDFIQSGLGKRQRSIRFDWEKNLAQAQVNDQLTELPLITLTLDEISIYTLIKQAISEGEQDIFFNVIDRNQVKEYHYRLVGEEAVASPVGTFSALKVERVRENSERETQLWFSPAHEMLLIKISHRDPDGDEYEISIKNALLNGIPVTAE